MTVEIRGLSKSFGGNSALVAIDLTVADGEFLALPWSIRSGKNHTAPNHRRPRATASGVVAIGGRDVRSLSPRGRPIGFVFQNYALFRHMTVARNIAFGPTVKPRRKRPSRAAIAARVEELLRLMQLTGLEDRFPSHLSGGQRQRAALARALAVDPQLLLLDEPFGALDAKVRAELREWLRELQRHLGLTTIFVTHDQHEACQLADRVAILHAGRIEQIGPPAQVYDQPASAFVTEFLGAPTVYRSRSAQGVRWPAASPCPFRRKHWQVIQRAQRSFSSARMTL